ncbi:hypothetical protein BV378_11235 [Nostoc sp. RF31YmG]|nr:hypothetical protein BV378_11235 [Nostoc sp. RF31YmG]OUL33255.1 hypothetical protein BV375_07550 [Nostoc sp. 106C]
MIRRKILVVDDDPAVRNLIQRFLTKLNYQVEAAADGETARAVFQSFHPDLVILDVSLPDVNIHDLCKEMQNQRTVFVLMLTTHLAEGRGADSYLTKPFGLGQLEARVAEVLNGEDG